MNKLQCEIQIFKTSFIIDRIIQRTFYHDWSLISKTERTVDKI